MSFLQSIVELWTTQIKLAKKARAKQWEKVARKCERYAKLGSPQIFLDTDDDAQEDLPFPDPRQKKHRPNILKFGEWVRMFLPWVMSRVPNRLVSPRNLALPPGLATYFGQPSQDPVKIVTAALLTHTENYTASDAVFDLRGESRMAAQDALLTGRGVLWHEVIDTPDGEMPGAFYDSVWNLLLDGSADHYRHANYAVRIRHRRTWEIAKDFGIPREKLRSIIKTMPGSGTNQVWDEEPTGEGHADWAAEQEGDSLYYYEVYSRCGLGTRLAMSLDEVDKAQLILDEAGDHVWLVLIPGLGYPANLPPEALETESLTQLTERLRWPIELFGDYSDPWPFSILDYYHRNLWPKPPLEDAIPLQGFMDFLYSFLMSKVRVTGRQLHFVWAGLEEEVRKAFTKGWDDIVVPTQQRMQDLKNAIYTHEFGQVNTDLWKILAAAESAFERSTGMQELMYGGEMSRQMRSAEEAANRQANMLIRPQDLAECSEAWQGKVARKDGAAQRLILREGVCRIVGELSPDEAQGIMGPMTQHWLEKIATDDAYIAASEYEYTVEAGSGRRKNRAKQLQDIQDSAQMVLPLLWQEYQATGDPTRVNAWFYEWQIAREADPSAFVFPPLQVQQPMPGQIPPEGEQPPTEGQQAPPQEALPPQQQVPV